VATARGLTPTSDTTDLPVRISRKVFLSSDGTPVPVLQDVAFSLAPGQFTCLVGPSGCGKTTTLRILLGLETEFEGTIDPAFSTRRVGVAFQDPRLLPWRTVEQNVRLALPDAMADRPLDRLLADVGLEGMNGRFPSELSLGMARRVSLARAFAIEPEILILDEPFVSLDETAAVRLRRLLLDLWCGNPVTVLMVTHNIREAAVLADRIIFMSQRPAHVVGTADVPEPRSARDSEWVQAFAMDLARSFPQNVTV
jgi:NitT/TauT family transport system ATP-binding protein